MFLQRTFPWLLFSALFLCASTPLSAAPKDEKKPAPSKPKPRNPSSDEKDEKKSSSKGAPAARESSGPAPSKKETETPPSLSGTFAIVNGVSRSPQMRARLFRVYSLASSGALGSPPEGDALKNALLASPHDKIRAKAKASLKKGRLLYAALKLTHAVSHLEKAKALFLRHVPRKQAIPALVSTLSYLMLSYNSLGMQKKARGTAHLLHLLTGGKRPEKVPAPLWLRLRRAKKKKKKRVLTIQAPKGASVYVDFAAPAQAKKKEGDEDTSWTLSVSPESHHVTVEAPGQQKFYKEVSAGMGSASVVSVMVPAAKDPYPGIRAQVARALGGDPLDKKTLANLARRARVQRLVVAKKGQTAILLQVYEAKKDKLLEPKIPLSSLETKKAPGAMAKWVASLVASIHPKKTKKKLPLKESARKAAARVTKKEPLKDKKKKKKATPIWKRWYFWVALGAVGVVTAVFALREDPSNKVEIQVHRP